MKILFLITTYRVLALEPYLCMVTTQASFSESCVQLHWVPWAYQICQMGQIGTVWLDRVDPQYLSKCTITASGRLMVHHSSMSTMVPIVSFTRPAATQRLAVNITQAPCSISNIKTLLWTLGNMNSGPLLSSDVALAALGPPWGH